MLIDLAIKAGKCAVLWNLIAFLPNSVVRLSAASRKAVVSMALSLLAFTGTSTKDFLRVSNQVPPGGYVVFAAIIGFAASFAVCKAQRTGLRYIHILARVNQARRAERQRATLVSPLARQLRHPPIRPRRSSESTIGSGKES